MNGRFADYAEPRDQYFYDVEEEQLRSSYPLRRLARIFAYLSFGAVGYVGAIVAVTYLASLVKS